jgi:hypothetical protein
MCCALIQSDIRFEFEIDHRLCLCHSEMDLSYLDNEKWHAFVRELLRNAAPSQLSIYNTFTEYQHFAQQYQLMQDERVCTFDTLTRSLVDLHVKGLLSLTLLLMMMMMMIAGRYHSWLLSRCFVVLASIGLSFCSPVGLQTRVFPVIQCRAVIQSAPKLSTSVRASDQAIGFIDLNMSTTVPWQASMHGDVQVLTDLASPKAMTTTPTPTTTPPSMTIGGV